MHHWPVYLKKSERTYSYQQISLIVDSSLRPFFLQEWLLKVPGITRGSDLSVWVAKIFPRVQLRHISIALEEEY